MPNPSSAVDPLLQAQRQVTLALERAHQREQRAMEAELRARWAERQIGQHLSLRPGVAGQHSGRSVVMTVLWIVVVGVVLGGFAALLSPVRERILAQDALVQELTLSQEQLRHENQKLRLQLETLTAARGESVSPAATK
jgi:cell division protein FtsB